jgi:hypothetical protein
VRQLWSAEQMGMEILATVGLSKMVLVVLV